MRRPAERVRIGEVLHAHVDVGRAVLRQRLGGEFVERTNGVGICVVDHEAGSRRVQQRPQLVGGVDRAIDPVGQGDVHLHRVDPRQQNEQ